LVLGLFSLMYLIQF